MADASTPSSRSERARPQLTDQDIAHVAAEGAINPADLAHLPGGCPDVANRNARLRLWLEGRIESYRTEAEAFASLPPQVRVKGEQRRVDAPAQSKDYANLERLVREARNFLDNRPWMIGDMIAGEHERLGALAATDGEQLTQIVRVAVDEVRRDVGGLQRIEERARARRAAVDAGLRGQETENFGPTKDAVDLLTLSIFGFWHEVLRRPILKKGGGVLISKPLARFACAVYRLADGAAVVPLSTARGRLKPELAKRVTERAQAQRDREKESV